MASSEDRLPAAECRDDAALEAFVRQRLSANGWPIHSRPLRRRIARDGLDLAAARRFTLPLPRLRELLRRIYSRALRSERMLGIDVAFHRPLHNLEVFLRLLVLEWPGGAPPAEAREAVARPYHTREAIEPVLRELMDRLLGLGFPSGRLARDLLAAVGHDYGHTGGTDRLDASFAPLPLTHEETAERHVARFGLEAGLPPALVLESLAGIRATTFNLRPGRRKIRAENDFERRLTLADVTGCVLPPDRWLTHVAMPVLHEKLPRWRHHLEENPPRIERLERRLAAMAEDAPERRPAEDRLAELAAQERAVIKDLAEYLRSELGFLRFIRAYRLEPVPAGLRLWGRTVDRKIALLERLVAREDLLASLAARGFALVEEIARELANAPSLEGWLAGDAVDPALRELFGHFLED